MGYRSAPNVKRPSEWLDDLLRGKIAMADAPDAVQSWARLAFYEAAVQIIAAPDKGTRKNMLGKIPTGMRPYVEAEVLRLWKAR